MLIKLNEIGIFGFKIEIYNVFIEEFVGLVVVIVKFLNSNVINMVIIKNSIFCKIWSYYFEKYYIEISLLLIVFFVDDLGLSICLWLYLSYYYWNMIIIENSLFVDNIGWVLGGVYFVNGNVIICSCIFENNFVIDRGGYVYIFDGSGSVWIENFIFK